MASTSVRVSLDEEAVAILDRIAEQRFGGVWGSRSAAVMWALQVLDEVLEHTTARAAPTPHDALVAYAVEVGRQP